MILLLSNDASKFSKVDVQAKELNISERSKAAVKRVTTFLLFAFISLFVPVFHFVLMPTFLLIAVVFGFVQFRQKQILIPISEINCLSCQSKLNCTAIEADKPIVCQHCLSRHILKEN